MVKYCDNFDWAPGTIDLLETTVIIAILAAIFHAIFWINVLLSSSLRRRNMMWIYGYLIANLFLLVRFFIFYGLRRADVCIYPLAQNILCYFEATSKIYINTIQSYLLLGLNICRYLQIVSSRNIYVEKSRLILLISVVICVAPALNLVIQFLAGWTQIWRGIGESCDIVYSSIIIQIFNLILIFFLPIATNIIILGLGIRHVSSIGGILSQQIMRIRRKRQRTLVLQSVVFYSIWFVLWCPDTVSCQFTNVNSDPAIFTSLLSFIEIALDPFIFMIIDLRFLTSWCQLWKNAKRFRQIAAIS